MKSFKIIVYVEGASDKLAMEALLYSLLDQLREKGISVEFIPTEGKKSLILKTPIKAINILNNHSEYYVVAYPDLYPANMGIPHSTFEELEQSLRKSFQEQMEIKKVKDARIESHFVIRCFKYDLEALLLATENILLSYIGYKPPKPNWETPVEDMNQNMPPKRIVDNLFEKMGQSYKNTIDAPNILRGGIIN
ncbi:DUF4276 family protein [Candidatus Sumerlaeota bacterium]|nr:DUF4276 family protein [Candidatus Sumerlaeota bacterium]